MAFALILILILVRGSTHALTPTSSFCRNGSRDLPCAIASSIRIVATGIC